MTRESVTGVLHVILTRKSRVRSGGWDGLFAKMIEQAAEDAGRLPRLYYPPTYYLHNGDTVDQRRERYSLDRRLWGADRFFTFRFKGRPQALDPALRGHIVTVRAAVQPWHNGLGGYLIRPHIESVDGYIECPYHDDPPGEYVKGSSRVHCTAPIADRAYPLPRET